MDNKLHVWIFCLVYIQVCVTVEGTEISECLTQTTGNLTDICTCETDRSTSNKVLICNFEDQMYGFFIKMDVTGVVLRGKYAMVILENATQLHDNSEVLKIDVQANEIFFDISTEYLLRFPDLQEIRLHNCSIRSIEKGAFSYHRSLTSVDLSGNSYLTLESVTSSFDGLKSPFLRVLNLSGIHNAENMPTTSLVHSFFEYVSGTHLEVLDISWIRITLVTGSFSYLEHLKVINLTGTTVLGEVDCVSTMLSLKNLETVVFNSWPALPRGYESIVHLPDPEYLYKRSIDYCVMFPIYNFTTGCYTFLPNVRTIQIRDTHLDSFYVDFTLPAVCFENNALVNFIMSGSRASRQIGKLINVKNLKFFDSSDLVSSFQEGPIIRPDAFSEMETLEVLLVRGCRLYRLTQPELSKVVASNSQLKVLDMSNNRLPSLPTDTFVNNRNLEVLNLSGNSLQYFNVDLKDANKLKMLDLERNKINEIEDGFVDNIKEIATNRTLTLLLTDNGIECTCNVVVLTGLVSNQSIIECYLKKKKYILGNRTDAFVPEELSDLCKPVEKTLSVVETFGIAFGTLSAFLLALIIIFYVVRKKFSKKPNKLTLITLPISNTPRLREPRFTVFLAYCYKDYSFAVEKLYPTLNQKLKSLMKIESADSLIVVNDQHFLPGVQIDVLIANAIKESFVTVAVISEDFLKSSWCRYEILKSFTENVPLIPLYISKVDPRQLNGILQELYLTRARILWPCDGTKKNEKAENSTIDLLCKSIVAHVEQTRQCIASNKLRNPLSGTEVSVVSESRTTGFYNRANTCDIIR